MPASPSRILLALAIVYVVWGSSYLAIRIGVQELPPFLMAGLRFCAASALLLLWERRRGPIAWPMAGVDWRSLGIAAVTMLVIGNGLVSWAEQWVPSNQAALIVASSALWIAGFGTLGGRGEALGGWTIAGLLTGFAGVMALVGGGLQARAAPLLAYAALLGATVGWALGSVYLRRYPPRCPPLVGAALQMLISGVLMIAIGLAAGEAERWQWSVRGLWALAYLVLFGSCLAYGAYYWLVQQVTPALLGTYAYVNPVVAVILGGLVLGETLTQPQWLGTCVILAGVGLVTLASRPRRAVVVA
jgi:drug/metabolite transporter (DMT)-like permease